MDSCPEFQLFYIRRSLTPASSSPPASMPAATFTTHATPHTTSHIATHVATCTCFDASSTRRIPRRPIPRCYLWGFKTDANG